MKKSPRFVKKQLSRVLAEYHAILQRNIDLLENKPTLATRIAFRLESANFFISQLDFWDETGDIQMFEETANRARKSLEDVYQLIQVFLPKHERDADDSGE